MAGWTRREVLAAGLAAPWLPVTGRPTPPAVPLATLLDGLVRKHRMPGALAAVWRDGKTEMAAAGVANLNTGVPMTVDTGFLTGSITKVWTSTLVMTFVDDGTLALDRPVETYLPHFRWAGGSVTVLQLLNHASGFDAGDLLLELGDGPAAHRRYADILMSVGQIHRPGAYSSYCNGAYILAGHLLEFLTGRSFDRLLRERVVEPLGLDRTVTAPEEAILHRTAVGSLPDPAIPGRRRATPKFLLPKSAAPAGSTLITTLADQLSFAAMHIGRGIGPSGRRVLTDQSAAAMATRTIGRPVGGGASGIGWGLRGQGRDLRLAHSGGSNGGIAQLVVYPERRLAFASFANAIDSYGFHAELQQRVLGQVVPAPAPASPPLPAEPRRPLSPESVVGQYRRKSEILVVRHDGGKFAAELVAIPEDFDGGEIYGLGQPRFALEQTGPTQLTSIEAVQLGQRQSIDFLELRPDGRYDLAYTSNRLSRRAD
ncbi:MAG: beta-lactamase family protein [Gemmatimonadetes bacterium]|nr:beta-lactamase family protein [Gemmatimonadota bacterium]